MKNNFSKILLITAIGFLIAPQVSFAAWWKPLTWFQKPLADAPISEVAATSTLVAENSQADVAPEINTENIAVAESEEGAVATKWWNPLTWKVFDRIQTVKVQEEKQPTEIEKLRSEVEELKKKIATPASSPAKPSTVVVDKSKATTKPVIPATKAVASAAELREPIISLLETTIRNYARSRDFVERSISSVEDAVNWTKELRSMTTGARDREGDYSSSDPSNTRWITFWNALIGLYNKDIQYYEDVENYFGNVITRIDVETKFLREEKTRILSVSLTEQQAQGEIKKIFDVYIPMEASIGDEIIEKMIPVKTSFSKYYDNKLAEYKQGFAYLSTRLGSPSSSPGVLQNSSQFPMHPLPTPISPPTYTQCFAQELGFGMTTISCH